MSKIFLLIIERSLYYVLSLRDGIIHPVKLGRDVIARSRLPAPPPARFGLLSLCRGFFETFVQGYDEQFSRQYGFWRPYFEQVIYRYPDYGDSMCIFLNYTHRQPRQKC